MKRRIPPEFPLFRHVGVRLPAQRRQRHRERPTNGPVSPD